jgi:hypothetical protein
MGTPDPNWTYTLQKIEVWYRPAGGGGNYTIGDASIDQGTKTWTFTNTTPLAAGQYEVKAVLRYTAVDNNTMPPTSYNRQADTGAPNPVVNVTNP